MYLLLLHTGPFRWPFLEFGCFFEKTNCCLQPFKQTVYHWPKWHFFQIFFSPTVWETKNLDAKLRTNDWPGGQKCSSTRSPRTGFSRCFFYSTRKNVLYVLCLRFQCQPSLYLKRKKLKKIYCMCNIKMSVIS